MGWTKADYIWTEGVVPRRQASIARLELGTEVGTDWQREQIGVEWAPERLELENDPNHQRDRETSRVPISPRTRFPTTSLAVSLTHFPE